MQGSLNHRERGNMFSAKLACNAAASHTVQWNPLWIIEQQVVPLPFLIQTSASPLRSGLAGEEVGFITCSSSMARWSSGAQSLRNVVIGSVPLKSCAARFVSSVLRPARGEIVCQSVPMSTNIAAQLALGRSSNETAAVEPLLGFSVSAIGRSFGISDLRWRR